MKISKLFHSLYALLMLAPIFAVGGAMAFNIINDKAVDNSQNEDITYQKVNYQYETNDVNSVDDFVSGNIYYFNIRTPANTNSNFSFLLCNAKLVEYTFFAYVGFSQSANLGTAVSNFCDYYLIYSNNSFHIDIYLGETFLGQLYKTISNDRYYAFNFYLVTNSINNDAFNHLYVDDSHLVTFSRCSYQHIPYTLEDVTITYPDNLSDNFYYALDSMNNSEVFSWAKTSFLAEPFSYIFGLFGIPSGSPFITLLSYWLSISIIWLVFDLVMYVPLLVHGWIDKGGIE